ncbi:NAD(P)H-binding protein, partial [Achromobacter sp. DMS1]|uniref:NAD(P)H-binding protein n=1 Tax=Achromobacter sp. DMS1 TaxID=1688405 RepID=UPI000AC564FB
MQERIFLAGATGAIGTALIPLLRAAGYEVYGSTRHADRAARLETAGVHPVVVDVFDAEALAVALMRIRPASIMHQLTDLATLHDPARAAETARATRASVKPARATWSMRRARRAPLAWWRKAWICLFTAFSGVLSAWQD